MDCDVDSFGLWVYPFELQARKGRSRRDYAEPYHMLYERSFTIRFVQVIRVQFWIEISVLKDRIKSICKTIFVLDTDIRVRI